jgi:hypothetical protein
MHGNLWRFKPSYDQSKALEMVDDLLDLHLGSTIATSIRLLVLRVSHLLGMILKHGKAIP